MTATESNEAPIISIQNVWKFFGQLTALHDVSFDVQPGDVLKIRPTEMTMTMLHPAGYDYFDLLRRKLKWNFMPTSVKRRTNSSGS